VLEKGFGDMKSKITAVALTMFTLLFLAGCSSSGDKPSCASECERQYSHPDKITQCRHMCRKYE